MVNFIQQVNDWWATKVPCLFLVDFEMQKPLAFKLDDVKASEILYDVNGNTNAPMKPSAENIRFERHPISLEQYQKKFTTVMTALQQGESYLTNLTIETPVTSNWSLVDLCHASKAKYKLWFRNEFLVFSPESFVKIQDGKIFSFPMKGTIDATILNAREIILADEKEKAEHVTIVDLIRNDLSLVADNVAVTRFRYVDELTTSRGKLLQVSSEISGELKSGVALGDVLGKILPAGSISGAPKKRTVEIIQETEKKERGYFTGVFGIFDGENVDSGVMIRFIENTPEGLVYRSGGGITAKSNAKQEYEEAIQKVYVPIY